jgi:16S rRNA (adenine1518-N6/adenine1519-N6)-dimethyltransferase
MNLTEMRQLLESRGILLTKSLGQNFLHDTNQLRRIVELAEVGPADRVLEVGPGLGPLTEALLEKGAEVLAIEKDARLLELLRERLGREPRLTLQHADALKVVSARRNWAGWKLVANLPYSVASPILVELALAEDPPKRLVATLQWEVARRLMAREATDDYGVLTLLVQLRFVPETLIRIPANCFFPAPDVESGCLRLERRRTDLLATKFHPSFVRIVKRAFSQRRKMMVKLLRADWDTALLERAMAHAGLPLNTRAEAVSLEQFGRLTEHLAAPLHQ